jgi:hypothetical protein
VYSLPYTIYIYAVLIVKKTKVCLSFMSVLSSFISEIDRCHLSVVLPLLNSETPILSNIIKPNCSSKIMNCTEALFFA